MNDIELQKYYNDVRGVDWPDIRNYQDFVNLPESIQTECIEEHGLLERRSQIESSDYWIGLSSPCYRFGNLVYVPITKCAQTYYINYFENVLGWEKTILSNIDWDNSHAFGFMMDPFNRRIKGIVEYLRTIYNANYKSAIADLDTNQIIYRMVSTILIPDTYTMSYKSLFGKFLDRINWIPLEIQTDEEIKTQVTNFLKKHNYTPHIDFPKDRLNKSPEYKLELYNRIKKIPVETDLMYILYIVYGDDLKVYNNLIHNLKK